MLDKRNSGVLMHISSMPSDYGIGVFDENCLHFIDKISAAGFAYWQVLPFHPVDHANSPYCSCSAFAGNYLFIDPKSLADSGLCTKAQAAENVYSGSPYTADYAFAAKKRLTLLKICYQNGYGALQEQIARFEAEKPWLKSFALYMALKEVHGEKPWWQWGEDARFETAVQKKSGALLESCRFWEFVQYVFFEQWSKIKRYANKKGVAVIGDMPVYVAMDSADIWANIGLFEIDQKTLSPTQIAGVPPDYFSEDGQLWGNPLYDWTAMKKDGYRWWLDRLQNALQLYDVVRIDHFRAFASYWAVPAGSKTAKKGRWLSGPGMDLFDTVFKTFGHPPIIAEDLGTFGEDVVQLLKDSGFPGIKVVQFGFDAHADSLHLPHHAVENCVFYLGTHDNNTLLGWLWEASEEDRRFALDYCGFEGQNWGDGGYQSKSCRKIIETVWKSSANTAIIAFQDLCGFGSDARMNIPGVPEKNWRYRTTRETIDQIDFAYFSKINSLYRRMYPLNFGTKSVLSESEPPAEQ